ncbi:MAG: nickel-dependent lactate racemase [Myxococcota bacterium]
MIKLKYGRIIEEVDLKTNYTLLDPQLPAPLKNPGDAIAEALANSHPSLEEVLSGASEIAVIVPDATRYAGAEIYCPVLAQAIEKIIPNSEITFIIANGLHRPPKKDEIERIIGQPLAKKYKVDFNDSDNLSKYEIVNEFPDGTPIEILRTAFESEKIIITGAVAIHYLAGFGGGRKALVPGIASKRTILAAHRLSLHPTPGEGRHPACRPANVAGNPMHERLTIAQNYIAPAYMLNTILSGDKKILDVFAGDPTASYQNAMKRAGELFAPQADRRFDVTIISAGGFPKDINLIQSHKTLENASYITKPGGTIILFAECGEGIGHPDFLALFSKGNSRAMDLALRGDFKVYGQTAVTTRKKIETFNVYIKTSLDDEALKTIGAKRFNSVSEINEIISGLSAPDVAVVPEGSTFCFTAK